MKSELKSDNINFDELTRRLRAYIRYRINNGEFTERSLARVLLVSQPQLHNILKGVRTLNMRFADRCMKKFAITVLDLMSSDELFDCLETRDPNWLTAAAKRKPPTKTASRDREDRSAWRTSRGGQEG